MGADQPPGGVCGAQDKPTLSPAERAKREEEERTVLIDAHYRRLLERPEAARRRAQAAYAIASAVAAAVLAAGALGKLNESPAAVQILGPFVLLGWLTAAGLFLWAIAAPYRERGDSTAKGFAGFRDAIFQGSRDERAEIERRQKRALIASAVAAALTLAAVVLSLALPRGDEMKDATLVFDKAAQQELGEACGTDLASAVVPGRVDTTNHADDTITVELPEGACGTDEVEAEFDDSDVDYVVK